MFETLKKTVLPSSRKRKAGALASPGSAKKNKNTSASPRPSSEPASEAINFEASVVPSTYRPKPGELLKSFDEIADGQSLVSQAEGFFKNATKVCIKNGSDWDALSRYRSAVYLGTSFEIGDDVLVMQDETPDNDSRLSPELQGRWVGRIIEIRAVDQENVYILMNWYNRPEDLPKLRQPHHGMNEVIATNDVDIISPTTLVGKVDIEHWIESDDTAPQDRTLFWRQCAAMEDRAKTRFSKLVTACTCKQPVNVDKMLLQCEECKIWVHDECLIKALAKSEGVPEKKWKRVLAVEKDGAIPDVLPNTFKLTPPKGKPWTVEIQVEQGMFVSKDRGDEPWEQKILCLNCDKWLR